MSLFGKMVPMKQGVQIHPEVRLVLEEVLVEAGRKPCGEKQYKEMVEDLYTHLEVIMFYEILTYLPGQYLDEFVRLNDQNRPRWEIDKFLEENMPNADEVIEDAVAKFQECYPRKEREGIPVDIGVGMRLGSHKQAAR